MPGVGQNQYSLEQAAARVRALMTPVGAPGDRHAWETQACSPHLQPNQRPGALPSPTMNDGVFSLPGPEGEASAVTWASGVRVLPAPVDPDNGLAPHPNTSALYPDAPQTCPASPPEERHGDTTPQEKIASAVAERASLFELPAPGLRILLLIGLLAAVAGGVYAWRAAPVPEPLSPPPAPPALAAAPSPATSPSIPPPAGPEVTVHITGKVRKPGVVVLPDGSRVVDAVKAAGGVKANARTDTLNLARKLIDGEQIVVGSPAAPAGPAPPPTGTAPPDALIDLNTATLEQLETLPGVGEVLARRILDYRTTHGGFRTVQQLQEVTGIGAARYADIKDKVRV